MTFSVLSITLCVTYTQHSAPKG